MPRSIKNVPLILFIIIVIGLIGLTAYTESGRESPAILGDILGRILSPLQRGLYSVSTYIHDIFAGIGERRVMLKEYENLKARVVELENELGNMEELKKQNQRLKGLAKFTNENKDIVVTGAHVTAKNPGNWFNTITIDRGKKHGIEVNMAVITHEGLVGRVIEVANTWSKVRTIVDVKSAVSGMVQRNRDNGLLKGNNSLGTEDGMCRMVYLPEDSNITPGDIILTSGLGGIFPKGLYIGKVEKVLKDQGELYKTAIVKPGVDFQRLEEVLVVKKEQ